MGAPSGKLSKITRRWNEIIIQTCFSNFDFFNRSMGLNENVGGKGRKYKSPTAPLLSVGDTNYARPGRQRYTDGSVFLT